MYRYWDGHAWSAVTTSNPSAPPPSQGLGQSSPSTGAQQQSYGSNQYGSNQYGSNQYGQSASGPGTGQFGNYSNQPSAYQAYQQTTQKKRSGLGWWLGGAAVLVVLIIVAVIVIRNVAGGGGSLNNPIGNDGSSNPCPTTTSTATTKQSHPVNDGRVHGGPISYPRLGSPWSDPRPDDRVPFGTDVQEQEIVTEPNYQPGNEWVASVLIAQLIAGDGFYTPQDGVQIVAKCVVGSFYGNNPVQRHDLVSKAMTIDGHKAWYLQSHLTFNIEGLKAKGETMTLVVVSAGATSGLFYSSIPDNAKQWAAPAAQALAQLTVDK